MYLNESRCLPLLLMIKDINYGSLKTTYLITRITFASKLYEVSEVQRDLENFKEDSCSEEGKTIINEILNGAIYLYNQIYKFSWLMFIYIWVTVEFLELNCRFYLFIYSLLLLLFRPKSALIKQVYDQRSLYNNNIQWGLLCRGW